tara:strand:+ start:340 stop:795 length:456 start_codon:yes stop_codon:yes gene_type:complete
MNKALTYLILFFFIMGCGFTPIYSGKDINFKVSSIEKNINNSYTNYLANSIYVFSNDNASKNFKINILYNANTAVVLKNKKGDPTKNRLSISVELKISDKNKKALDSQVFIESFEYTVQDNKFEMKQYEKNIKQNLVEDISDQILIYLAGI